jgi:hypothetical protein
MTRPRRTSHAEWRAYDLIAARKASAIGGIFPCESAAMISGGKPGKGRRRILTVDQQRRPRLGLSSALERAYRNGKGADIYIIRVGPFLDELRGHPRFEALAEKIVPAHELAKSAAPSK